MGISHNFYHKSSRPGHKNQNTNYMNSTYLHSLKKYLLASQSFGARRLLLAALLVLAQTVVFGQVTGDYRSNGNVTFATATNWQIYNGTGWVSTTIAPKDASYTVSNTINVRSGDAATVSISVTIAANLLVEGTFTLNSGANLSIGPIVLDYNGVGNAVVVGAGSALTVNGNFTVKKGDMSVAGTVYIDGDFKTTTGNVDVTGGGSMASSGSMTTQGSGTIFGSGNDCGLGPCSGTSLDCPSTISPPSQVICQSSQSAPITLTGSGATVVKWQSTTDFLTFTDIINTTTTLPAQTLTQTTRFRAVYTSSGCTGNINSPYATVTVTPTTSGGTVAGGTTICSGNTSGLLTLSGHTGTVVKWQSSVSPFSTWTDIANTSTTYTSGALTTTTQFRAVVQSGTCTLTSLPTTVTVNNTNTWTGTSSSSWFTATNWSCGSVPSAASDVTIPNVSNKPVVNDTSKIALANTITVSSGASLTVNSGNTLKVTDKVTNNSGTITFENSASLVQINNVANSGNIIYKRNYTGGEMDYTYWSSPVASQNLLALSPATKLDKFFSFNGTDWVQETPSTTAMTDGKGYIIRGVPPPSGLPVGFGTLTFNGVPNNGAKSIAVVGSVSSNLLGNPYPSAIDADKFILANSTVIDGTLYFWTHNTPIAIGTPDPGTGVYAYSGNDYATYTLSGGVGTSGNFNDINGNGILDSGEEVVSNRPTGKIAAGQSFFTTSTTAGGTVNFTNAMRVDGLGNPLNNSNFYKTKNPRAKTDATIEKHRVWLNLTNEQGAFKQTLVGYITGATNTWDKLYDGESFDGNDFLDFYSINEDKNLTIQGRALPFDENDEVSLGYRIAVAGTFTIKIDETDGILSNKEVFLEDKLTNKTVNLKEGKYTFNTAAGTFDDRFVLRYASKTLGTTDFDGIEKTVLVSVKNKQIKVSSFGETIEKVTIFDLLGRKLYQKDKINSNEFVLTDFASRRETYIIKTTLQNGKVVSEKIIY